METEHMGKIPVPGLSVGIENVDELIADLELNRRIVEDANLWLDPGNIFGREGEMFQRINAATSREYLEKGLKALVENLLKP